MAKITDDPKVAEAIEKASSKARKTAIADAVRTLKACEGDDVKTFTKNAVAAIKAL